MKKISGYSVLIIWLICLLSFWLIAKGMFCADIPNTAAPKPKGPVLNLVGEKITYEIKLGNINLGQAEYTRQPDETIDSRLLNLSTFVSKLARFSDTEKIYSDPQTFLPVRIERDISNWPFKEKIVENYDQKEFTLTVNKSKGARTVKLVIKTQDVIHNPILLPFYVRGLPHLKVGWTKKITFPRQNFFIGLVGVEEVNTSCGQFKAYRFESTPERFKIWISTDERRIPLKIKGTGNLGYTLILKKYEPGR